MVATLENCGHHAIVVEDHSLLNGDDDVEEAEEADELTFDIERNLQRALRADLGEGQFEFKGRK